MEAEEERVEKEGGGLDSQRIQVKERQGNQTISFPVSEIGNRCGKIDEEEVVVGVNGVDGGGGNGHKTERG